MHMLQAKDPQRGAPAAGRRREMNGVIRRIAQASCLRWVRPERVLNRDAS